MTPPPTTIEIPPLAEEDLRQARDYIARNNREAGARLVAETFEILRILRDSPELGAQVPERDDALRAVTVPGFRAYRLYYQYDEARSRLRVVRLLHSARDPDSLLPD